MMKSDKLKDNKNKIIDKIVTSHLESSYVFPGDFIKSSVQLDSCSLKNVNFSLSDKGFLTSKIGGFVVNSPIYPYFKSLLTLQKKYIPCVGDLVIGVVVQKSPDNYFLDINDTFEGNLGTQEFQNATKKDKPNLSIGSQVYCIVKSAPAELNSELTCISQTDTKPWSQRDNYFGRLYGGYLLNIPIAAAHSLMGDNCFILEKIGQKIKFEVAIGLNGRIWVKAASNMEIMVIMNVIKRCISHGLTAQQIQVTIDDNLELLNQTKV